MLGAAHASAQAAAVDSPIVTLESAVQVEAGATCLESERLVEHIESWLGSSELKGALSIEVHGSPTFAHIAWFRIVEGATTLAERRFEPAPTRCEDMHSAVGLAIALALKASLLDSIVGHGGGDRVAHANPARWLVGLSAVTGFAVTPGINAGAALHVRRVLSESLTLRVSALGSLGPDGEFPVDQGAFSAWLIVGRLDVCPTLVAFDGGSLSVCLGAAGGGIYVAGRGFEPSREELTPYIGVANAMELLIDLGRSWALSLEADVLVPIERARFVVRDGANGIVDSRDAAAAGALFSLGVAYRF